MVPLGNLVLRKALQQARIWQDLDMPVRVAVNVSPLQIDEPHFADMVFESLDDAGVPPVALALEITESALARNWESAVPQIQRLRAAGVNISLDDFGTGYSSLGRLYSLQIDRVKIDRSFVSGGGTGAGSEPGNLGLIRDIIAIAHRLGYGVVGEGIESPEQMRNLRAMNCDEYQGFLLSRPVSGDEASSILMRQIREASPSLSPSSLSNLGRSLQGRPVDHPRA